VKNVRFVGLDVHAETIAVAVAELNGEVRSLGVIPNRAESVGRLMRKLGKPEQLRVCVTVATGNREAIRRLHRDCGVGTSKLG
jgi:hypothetical protein